MLYRLHFLQSDILTQRVYYISLQFCKNILNFHLKNNKIIKTRENLYNRQSLHSEILIFMFYSHRSAVFYIHMNPSSKDFFHHCAESIILKLQVTSMTAMQGLQCVSSALQYLFSSGEHFFTKIFKTQFTSNRLTMFHLTVVFNPTISTVQSF